MENLRNYGDFRQRYCPYCGGVPETADHVPSKVLLDEPLPKNLPNVGACVRCNNGFSQDEEYLACLIDCTVAGGVSDEVIGRDKIRRILAAKPALRERLRRARAVTPDGPVFAVEQDRVRNVVLKLARGHAAFELNEPQTREPEVVSIVPLHVVKPAQLTRFERVPVMSVWPEVGSRALQRAVITFGSPVTDWIVVQPGRYRYLVITDSGVAVRMVLSKYLACEVIWRD